MKTLMIMTITTVVALTSGFATADSKVKNSEINVYSENKNAKSDAYGDHSLSSVGSVNLRDSKVKDHSKIDVYSKNEDAESYANGDYSTSSVGSVTAE